MRVAVAYQFVCYGGGYELYTQVNAYNINACICDALYSRYYYNNLYSTCEI